MTLNDGIDLMNTWSKSILQKFKRSSTIEQLIYINIIVFTLSYLISSFSGLTIEDDHIINQWFALPSSFNKFIIKPWTLVTYGFLHGGIFHIAFNLLILFYIGNLFLDFFTKRDFLSFFFSGIAVGGLFYLLSYSFYPGLNQTQGFLVGASAGVTAILVGLATKIPNYRLQFRFIGGIKLWHIAAAFILIDLIQLSQTNTGGRIAHLGGAFIGYLLSRISATKKVKKPKKGPLKTVFKNREKTNTSKKQKQIDTILDKISKSGYEALTQEEKDFLFSLQNTKSNN